MPAITGDEVCAQYGLTSEAFAAMPLNIRALYRAAYAADVLKVREEPEIGSAENPDGSGNRGPEVDRYNLAAGAALGSPWCASFKTCMLLDSGADHGELPPDPASVHAWLAWAKAKDLVLGLPVRGSVGLIIESAAYGHLVSVSEYEPGGEVRTIEGNTNPGGSREGYGVFRRTRPVSQFHCFVDLSGIG